MKLRTIRRKRKKLLKELCELNEKYNAIMSVDEVNGEGQIRKNFGDVVADQCDRMGISQIYEKDSVGTSLLTLLIARQSREDTSDAIIELIPHMPQRRILNSCAWGGNFAGLYPLHIACTGRDKHANSRPKIIKYLVDAKADIEARTYQEMTPLLIAAGAAYIDAVKMLVELGADIFATGGKGDQNVAEFAMRANNPDLAQWWYDKTGTKSLGIRHRIKPTQLCQYSWHNSHGSSSSRDRRSR